MEKEKYFESYLARQTELESGRYVYLNVYNISKLNYFLRIFGLGLYHTTIEIDDLEYSFGSTEDEFSGIYVNKKNEVIGNLVLKEKILLGFTVFSNKKILSTLIIHSEFWLGKSYDPFKKNCNDFTKFMSEIIIKNFFANYPLYINRTTEFGIFFYCFYTPIKILYGDALVTNNKQAALEKYNLKQDNDCMKNSSNISLRNDNKKKQKQQQYSEVPRNEEYNNTDNNGEKNDKSPVVQNKLSHSNISKRSNLKTKNRAKGIMDSKISDSKNGFISQFYFEEQKFDKIKNINCQYDNNKENIYIKSKGSFSRNIGAKLNASKRNTMNQDSVLVLEKFIKKFNSQGKKSPYKSSESIIEVNKTHEFSRDQSNDNNNVILK